MLKTSLADYIYINKMNLQKKIFPGEGADITTYKNLMAIQSLSRDEIKYIQFTRFKYILGKAWNESEFYHDKYKKSGIEPDDIKSFDDICKIPVLTKEELRENLCRMVCKSVNAKKLSISSTGGSTGKPVKVYHKNDFPYYPLKWRMISWYGETPSSNFATIHRGKNSWFYNFSRQLKHFPALVVGMNTADVLSEEKNLKFISECRKKSVKYIQGYEGTIYNLACYMVEHDICLPLKFVFTSSSPLFWGHRQIISKAFSCPVYDQYGCSEIPFLAAECSHSNGMHIFEDIRLVEFLNNRGGAAENGELGFVTISDLLNDACPLLRYQNEDKGCMCLTNCSCGLPFALMNNIHGRMSDSIYFRNGSYISGEFLTTIFDPYPDAVENFQIYQDSSGDITLFYVPSNHPNSPEMISRVINRLEGMINNNAGFKVESISHINTDRGKSRYIISDFNLKK